MARLDMHLYNKQTDPFNYFLIRLAVEYMPSGFIKAKPFRISAQSLMIVTSHNKCKEVITR